MSDAKSPEELVRIINEGLRPHSVTIAGIGFTGDVAVAVLEPDEETRKTARAIGWDGESVVFRLSPEARKTLSGSASAPETGLAKWLRKKFEPAKPVAKILVLTRSEPLMLNFSAFEGWSVETGEEDAPKPPAADSGKPDKPN